MSEAINNLRDSTDEHKTNKEAKFSLNSFYKTILSMIYDILLWRNPLTTIAVFMTLLTMEISLMLFSVISVLAYMGLTFLIVTTSLKLYLQLTGESNRSNFLQDFIDSDVNLAGNTNHREMTHEFINNVDTGLRKLKGLLLIEDYFESLKLAIVLYILTYIGARFNFMTICLTVTVVTFILPKVYRVYKVEIDGIYKILKEKMVAVGSSIRDKLASLPGVGAVFRRSISHSHNE